MSLTTKKYWTTRALFHLTLLAGGVVLAAGLLRVAETEHREAAALCEIRSAEAGIR